MSMLKRQLRAWQCWEWLFKASWGVARWLTLVIVGLIIACFTDWSIDRRVETPFAVRFLMTAVQVAIYALGAYWFIFRLRVPDVVSLASRAERAIPEFGHRLVTALQLNSPGARTAGMSQELIREVTREAEEMSARHRLSKLAKPMPLLWALVLAVPVLLLAGGFAFAKPQLVKALLARQLLLSADIPRTVYLKNLTSELWPSGDEVTLEFEVTGPIKETQTGTVRVLPDDQPAETFPLTFSRRLDDNRTVFSAKLPPSSEPFSFRAWLADGRLRAPGRVRFEPRPVVSEINAWVLLPKYVDPAGKKRFERFQPQGEVLALADSSVRVAISTSKPVATATLIILARNDTGAEVDSRKESMKISADGQSAEITFELPSRPSGYRIELQDRNGFTNANPPRRGITVAPEEPPHVNLLQETLKGPGDEGSLDDYEVNGLPLALGGQVQVAYAARSPLGLSRAQVMYRVNEGPWSPLPLTRVSADLATVGKFIPELGLFEKSAYNAQVEFYPIASVDPENEPDGLEAGGRYNFQTAALTKPGMNGVSKLEVGDRVEFFVEVFDRKNAAGRSESRIKTVVTQTQLQGWLDQHDQSRERLRQLEDRQRGVFGRPKADR